jgi:hypothetical protein
MDVAWVFAYSSTPSAVSCGFNIFSVYTEICTDRKNVLAIIRVSALVVRMPPHNDQVKTKYGCGEDQTSNLEDKHPQAFK